MLKTTQSGSLSAQATYCDKSLNFTSLTEISSPRRPIKKTHKQVYQWAQASKKNPMKSENS